MREQRCITCRHGRPSTGGGFGCRLSTTLHTHAAVEAAVNWMLRHCVDLSTIQDPPCPTYDHRPDGEEASHD